MAVTRRTEKILWGRAGATCAFADCKKTLISEAAPTDREVALGEIAHIVAQQPDGPRGDRPFPGGQIDGYDNLLLLCHAHHETIDGQPLFYTVERLVQIKADHEKWVQERLTPRHRFLETHQPTAAVTETVHSTLLPVTHLPKLIYSIKCDLEEPQVRDVMSPWPEPEVMLPYIVRADRLLAFFDLTVPGHPFSEAIRPGPVGRHPAEEWWSDPDRSNWYVTLLNRSLNKLTGRRGLQLEKDHDRYYFAPETAGKEVSVTYRTLTGRRVHKRVVWNPVIRKTGEVKKYWEHFAVGLRFHRVAKDQWCLSIRPERRFTYDGIRPITPKGTGRRSTSRKSHMYNIDVLEEVQFWRDFLSGGSPRIVFKYGSQNLVVSTELLSGQVTWPGVPGDARPFTYTRFEEDLFTQAALAAVEAQDGHGLDELDTGDWNDDEADTEA